MISASYLPLIVRPSKSRSKEIQTNTAAPAAHPTGTGFGRSPRPRAAYPDLSIAPQHPAGPPGSVARLPGRSRGEWFLLLRVKQFDTDARPLPAVRVDAKRLRGAGPHRDGGQSAPPAIPIRFDMGKSIRAKHRQADALAQDQNKTGHYSQGQYTPQHELSP